MLEVATPTANYLHVLWLLLVRGNIVKLWVPGTIGQFSKSWDRSEAPHCGKDSVLDTK